ncbi:hypothetical protein GCM10011575_33180 [Microlunatus endophyticus]|uniref:Uncharacterized protein n=1 Tax=Microlunatus endophyticus TaxID=1716077 RepID=A0A917W5U1_9ACTN|nr:hypothetical protein [Microlunatus endophyticus]GGL72143.1 hypothetical protein GCM10011575_33180 [Microlunatus endophyticus]
MPREYRMLSAEPADLTRVLDAAREVDPGLRPRLLFGGWAVQLLDDEDIAVLTIEASRRLDDVGQAEQLLESDSEQDLLDHPPDGPLWWTEASAPWGPYGEPGARLARRIAASISARFIAEEG